MFYVTHGSFYLLSVLARCLFSISFFPFRYFRLFCVTLIIVIIGYTSNFPSLLGLCQRKKGGNVRKRQYWLGAMRICRSFIVEVTDDPTSGYRVMGCFQGIFLRIGIRRMFHIWGQPNEVSVFRKTCRRDQPALFSLPSVRSAEDCSIVGYC